MSTQTMTAADVREDLERIATSINTLQQLGFEFYGMDTRLLVVDPAGVKAMAGRCLAETAADERVRAHTTAVCSIDDSGGW